MNFKVLFYSSKDYDKQFFNENNSVNINFEFSKAHLDVDTAKLAEGFDAICIFVNDKCDAKIIKVLAEKGIKLIALRCAGFNNVNLEACKQNNIEVVRVPKYSPYAVAEHTIALIQTLNRKIHKAYNHVREGNFSLTGLTGFDLNGKTAGLIGFGAIGSITAKILNGFGMQVKVYDPFVSQFKQNYIQKADLEEILKTSDLISLHCPLNESTHHIINNESLKLVKPNLMLINTSRGGLIDTKAVIKALKEKRIAYLGLDVYEEEADIFFEDKSETIIQDDDLMRLITFPNVIITSHQAFFTIEALNNIATTTINNMIEFNKAPQNMTNSLI